MPKSQQTEPKPAEAMPVAIPQIDTQIATARQYPRDVARCVAEAKEIACLDLETAAGCRYAKPQGGKMIRGPSVRLAEIIASTWGNIKTAARLVREEDKRIVVEAVAWDLQSNRPHSEEVSRSVMKRNGERYPQHMVETAIAAAKAIALRNAIFAVIPQGVVKSIEAETRHYVESQIGSVEEEWSRILKAFDRYGVKEEDLRRVLNKPDPQYDRIDASDIVEMLALGVAFREGQITRDDLFNTRKRARAAGGEIDLTKGPGSAEGEVTGEGQETGAEGDSKEGGDR